MTMTALPFDPVAEAERQWARRGWGHAAPGMALVVSVMRVHQVLLAKVDDVLRPLDLTFARYEVLMLLSFTKKGVLPLGKVGERLQVRPASVTNVIDRLEGQGLVERLPHEADGRVILARVTRRGRLVARKATALLNDEVFEDLGVPEKEIILTIELMTGLRRAAGDFD